MNLRLRDSARAAHALAVSAGVAVLVLAFAMFVVAALGMPLRDTYGLAISAAVGSPAAIHDTLVRVSLLILTGLAAAIALRIRLNNFGGEGQFLGGAIAAIAVGEHSASFPSWATFPLDLVAGAFAGALLMGVAARLKLRRGVEEAIVTLLLNVVMVIAGQVLLDGPLAGHAGAAVLEKSELPVALLIALGICVAISFATRFTVWGFRLRATAGNAEAARFAGIRVGRLTMRVGLFSGALAGIAGACQIASLGGEPHAGFGYAGIAVAMLAWLSPLGTIVTALFVAALMTAADAVVHAGAPASLPDMLVALMLLLSLIAGVLVRHRAGKVAGAMP